MVLIKRQIKENNILYRLIFDSGTQNVHQMREAYSRYYHTKEKATVFKTFCQ
jgi:hypothetical protein